MTHQPAPNQEAPSQQAPSQQDEDAQYYRTALHTLIDLGTDLARHVHAQATRSGPTTPPETAELTRAFDRVARAVRRTILLARKLSEPPAKPAQTREAARSRILRDVEDAIHRKATPAEAESLQAELRERLDAPELAESLDDEIARRPIADIIADITRDLGVAVQGRSYVWKRRTPADIAILQARAAHRAPPDPPRRVGWVLQPTPEP